MSLRLGTTLISGVATNTVKNSAQLLEARWFDHTLNNQEWLNADTFSWQSGTVYSEAYNHLVADLVDATASVETVGSYSITVYTATDGHKIVLDDMESTVANIFNATGFAWYYILDTTNQRFKLPRSTYNKYSKELPIKGNGMTLGITNGTLNAGLGATSDSPLRLYSRTASYGQDVSTTRIDTGTALNGVMGVTTDPTKSGIIASSVSDTNMKLYFYVGQFSQTATEQTAGLNSELFNQKADVDLSNVLSNIDYIVESKTPTASDPTWYRIYKSGWVEQGGHVEPVGASSKEVILPVEMADNNYTCLVTVSGNDNDTGGIADCQQILCGNGGTYNYLWGKSTTRIRTSSASASGFNWIAMGYAAQQ